MLKDLPKNRPKNDMKIHMEILKKQLTDMYQSDTILKYPNRVLGIPLNSLTKKMQKAINCREFKYG